MRRRRRRNPRNKYTVQTSSAAASAGRIHTHVVASRLSRLARLFSCAWLSRVLCPRCLTPPPPPPPRCSVLVQRPLPHLLRIRSRCLSTLVVSSEPYRALLCTYPTPASLTQQRTHLSATRRMSRAACRARWRVRTSTAQRKSDTCHSRSPEQTHHLSTSRTTSSTPLVVRCLADFR